MKSTRSKCGHLFLGIFTEGGIAPRAPESAIVNLAVPERGIVVLSDVDVPEMPWI